MSNLLNIREDTFSIKVSGLDSETTLDDIKYTFSKFGHVSNIYVPKPPGDEYRGIRDPKEVRCLKNCCFVRYFAKEEADKAINKLNGKVIDGKRLELTLQRNRRYIQEVEMQVKMMEAKGIDASNLKKELASQGLYSHSANEKSEVKKEGSSRSPKREREFRESRNDRSDRDRRHSDRDREYRTGYYQSSSIRGDRYRRSRSRDRSRREYRSPKRESDRSRIKEERHSDQDRYRSSKR